jgi:hypothetical protein
MPIDGMLTANDFVGGKIPCESCALREETGMVSVLWRGVAGRPVVVGCTANAEVPDSLFSQAVWLRTKYLVSAGVAGQLEGEKICPLYKHKG